MMLYTSVFYSEFKGGSEDEAFIYYTMTFSMYYAVYLKFRRSSQALHSVVNEIILGLPINSQHSPSRFLKKESNKNIIFQSQNFIKIEFVYYHHIMVI